MDLNLSSVRVLELDVAERRVRLRVLLTHYQRSWGVEGLLPDDTGFFFGVLRQAADGVAKRSSGPLNEVVDVDDYLDASWVAANAHRFVAGVERPAARNLPVSDEDTRRLADFPVDHHDSLDGHLHRWDDPWAREDRLVQADYDVWVTDPRWLAPLRRGQGWSTDAFPASSERVESGGDGPAAAMGRACLGLGWIREQDRGDLEGASAVYRRAAREAYWQSVRELGGTEPAGRAVLKLGRLPADLGETVAARAAYVCVTELGDAQAAGWAWLESAWLHTETGDDEAAEEAYATVAHTGRPGPAAIAQAVLDSTRKPSRAEHRAHGSDADAEAAYRYAVWPAARNGKPHVRALMLKIAADVGNGAARAALILGVDADRADDPDAARDWFLRAGESGDPRIAHIAVNNLGLLAKKRRDLPEALHWFTPIADPDHPDAPLAALLRQAVECGDATFAPRAAGLLNDRDPG